MSTTPTIALRIVNPLFERQGLALPAYATAGSAAIDLRACIERPHTLPGGAQCTIDTGIALDLVGSGLVAIIASRSGLARDHRIRVAQGIGVVDSDYHGEIRVLLANDGDQPFVVEPGMRIAQLLFQPVVQVSLQRVAAFESQSARGSGGFGSTGVR